MSAAIDYVMTHHAIPSQELCVDPGYQNEHKYTVAMLLCVYNIMPPDCWYHNPNIRDENGWTVAMCIARYMNVPIPFRWHHNPTIQTDHGYTVAMTLAVRNIKVPDEWIHAENLHTVRGFTLQRIINSTKVPCYTCQSGDIIGLVN